MVVRTGAAGDGGCHDGPAAAADDSPARNAFECESPPYRLEARTGDGGGPIGERGGAIKGELYPIGVGVLIVGVTEPGVLEPPAAFKLIRNLRPEEGTTDEGRAGEGGRTGDGSCLTAEPPAPLLMNGENTRAGGAIIPPPDGASGEGEGARPDIELRPVVARSGGGCESTPRNSFTIFLVSASSRCESKYKILFGWLYFWQLLQIRSISSRNLCPEFAYAPVLSFFYGLHTMR